jgi:hypothetical protein
MKFYFKFNGEHFIFLTARFFVSIKKYRYKKYETGVLCFIFCTNFLFQFYIDRQINCVALAKPGQYSNKKPNEMSKNALLFFKYGLAKLYLIFPIVRIFQITRKLVHN